MKYILGTLCLAASVYAHEVIIEKQKSFYKELKPNSYTSSFSVQMEEHKENTIEKEFQKLLKTVASYDMCEGGKYRINPHYKNDTYQGYINFNCSFEDKQSYEKLLSEVKSYKGKVSQGQIGLLNNEESIKKVKTELEKMALAYPKVYSEFLSKNLEGYTKCQVKTIDLQSENRGFAPSFLRSNEAKTDVSVPLDEKVKHTLNVHYTFSCKE